MICKKKAHVAVIGAGAAGLCVARHVLSRPQVFHSPVLYEASGHLGGTWFYQDSAGTDDDRASIHSSMYRDLRTNLPKEVMMFPDFPFEDHLPSFLHHTSIQQYLEKYCDVHDIARHIKFNTMVEKVKPVAMETTNGGAVTWEVISCTRGDRSTQTFDSVFVCNGHYSDPRLPSIPGIRHFKGDVLHSHSYRCPDPFAGKAVVVLGARSSGVDISIELAQANAKVILSHGTPPLSLPQHLGIQQVGSIVGVLENGSLQFHDGSVAQAETLLYCTGYNFNFPFLCASELGLDIQNLIITPLYKYLLPPAFPSIFFVGVCKVICPFITFDCQVRFALGVLEGLVDLPTKEEMEEEVAREMQRKIDAGVSVRHLLDLGLEQWSYYLDLAKMAQFTPPQPVIRSLYEEVGKQRARDLQMYRHANYRLVDATQWELVEVPQDQCDLH